MPLRASQLLQGHGDDLLYSKINRDYSSDDLKLKLRAASFSFTSCRDFLPRLRTFIMSSSVRRISSSTVLIPARLRQLYDRTERSSSSMVISSRRFLSSSSF